MSTPAPETLMKQRKAIARKAMTQRVQQVRKAKTASAKKDLIFKRAEQYASEYRKKERELVRLRREARNTGAFFREPESKLMFAVRIRGINGASPRTRKILRLLRLRQIFNGVFVKVNKATHTMLRLVEPYVTYGYPNLKTVKELIYKRGYGKVDGQRVPLVDNALIEKHLGRFGLICTEDLVHEIYTVGENFKEANKFLWPFKLNSPRGGLVKKVRHYVEGGDAGNREDAINKLVRRMI